VAAHLETRHRQRGSALAGGTTVGVAHEDSTVALLDARTGRTERILHLAGAPGFSAAAFSPDGTLATGTWAGILQRWKPASGTQIGAPTLVAAAPVASISFDPAGECRRFRHTSVRLSLQCLELLTE
jgi:hypothetical protein